MRILRARIGSFGNLRDREVEFSPGLNVVYGENEAGKSTLRTFITNTLFPASKLRYPAPKQSDSGTLDVELSDGQRMRFERDGKKSNGSAEGICGITSAEYISIYSISPDELRDTDSISGGNIRNRFLTIPGGRDLPQAYAELDRERREYLPDQKWSSKSIIADSLAKSRAASERVRELKSRTDGDDHYAELLHEKENLESRLRQADEEFGSAQTAAVNSARREVISKDIERIRELEAQAELLKYAERADDDARNTYIGLQVKAENSSKTLRDRSEALTDAKQRLGGLDADRILASRENIEKLSESVTRYEYLNGQAARGTSHPDERTEKHMRMKPLSAVGLLIMAAGLAIAGLGISLYGGVAVAVAGAAIFAVVYQKSSKTVERAPAVRRNREAEAELSEIEELWMSTCSAVGIKTFRIQDDARRLSSMKEIAAAYRDALNAYNEAADEDGGCKADLDYFLKGFGGKDRFEKALEDCRSYNETVNTLNELKNRLPEDAYEEVPEVTVQVNDVASSRDTLIEKKTRVDEAIKSILNDTEVEEAITAASDADGDVYNAVLGWARLYLTERILDDACEKAYSAHRPSVIQDTDAFLSSMTGGRYGMNLDPKEQDITVVDRTTGEIKGEKEWSTGLGDQVKLSIRMAVSLSLSKEMPPVILDDVLLTSDSGRKRGAAEAIRLLSDRIQVIYFTCDRESRNLLAEEGASVTEL